MSTLASFVNHPQHVYLWNISIYYNYDVKQKPGMGEYVNIVVAYATQPTESEIEVLLFSLDYVGYQVTSVEKVSAPTCPMIIEVKEC